MFFGVHAMYRERLHRAHPASHASLADFRAFVRVMMVEWSDANLLATVFSERDLYNGASRTFRSDAAMSASIERPAQGTTKLQRTAFLASTLLSLLEVVIGLHHLWTHRIRANADSDDVHKYVGKKRHGTGWTFSNTTLIAAVLSVPIASLVWAVLCFMVAVSSYCLQSLGTNTGRIALLGTEIGTYVLAVPLTLLFFSNTWKGRWLLQ
ncbi:hypothetical protein F5148DRAFT_285702 [Russula earlei]|uniref:Uncharacterized protein n=1 Tax=Russula earlei TaxID=71964 RepID=A0ACC0UNL8_9AGAM|nr:hypothetical protein F5148DRAFT_285702 [Russula earlei]